MLNLNSFSAHKCAYYTFVVITALALTTIPAISYSDVNNSKVKHISSKRVEVYSLSQNYWDVHSGDTLNDIVQHLLPNNPSKYDDLKKDIVHLNPSAFINGSPERLLAGKKLFLPGYIKQADSKVNPDTTRVERYSWGNIKRAKD